MIEIPNRLGISTPDGRVVNAVWWLLWTAAVVLLSFYFRVGEGARALLPGGQYAFFAVALTGLAILAVALRQRITQLLDGWLATVLLLLFFALALSAWQGLQPLYGLRLLAILAVTALPFLILGGLFGRNPTRASIVPLAVVAIACAVGTVLLQWTGPVTVGGVLIENFLFARTRWAFLFQEANGLGWMLALGVGATLYLAATSRTTVGRLLLLGVVLPVVMLVFLKTNSRASLAWILVYLAGYGALSVALLVGIRPTLRLPVALATLAVLLACGALLTVYWDSIAGFLRLHQKDLTSGRLQVWLRFFDVWTEHPGLGVGFGSTSVVTADLKGASPLNVYIGILGEGGLAGLVPFLVLWAGAVWHSGRAAIRTWAQPNAVSRSAFFVVLTLVGLALQQNGEWTILRISPVNYLFFFLVGAAWAMQPREAKPNHDKAPAPRS